MSYHVVAYQGNRKIKVPLEKNHLYQTTSTISVLLKKHIDPSSSSTVNTNSSEWTSEGDFKIVFDTNNLSIEQGVDTQQRRGDKVFLKTYVITYVLRLDDQIWSSVNYTPSVDYPAVPGTSASSTAVNGYVENMVHRQCCNFYVHCRLMLVHFDEIPTNSATATHNYIVEWFNSTYNYMYRYSNISGPDTPTTPFYRSVHEQRMHLSTDYTGKFKVLRDDLITLTNRKTSVSSQIVVNPRKQITFEPSKTSSIADATDDWFQNTYLILIGPSTYRYDFDGLSFRHLTVNYPSSASTLPGLLHFESFVKYEFYDLN